MNVESPSYGGDGDPRSWSARRALDHALPADIDLMFHFCYGDAGHKHVHSSRPTWATWCEFANRLTARVTRPIQLIHMPVPRDRSDDAYFEPLKRLTLKPRRTRLCLGLVHYTGRQLPGNDGSGLPRRRNMRADFRSAPNADFGRRDPADGWSELLRIHAEVTTYKPPTPRRPCPSARRRSRRAPWGPRWSPAWSRCRRRRSS